MPTVARCRIAVVRPELPCAARAEHACGCPLRTPLITTPRSRRYRNGLQTHSATARDGLPDAGQPARARAGDARDLAARGDLRAHARAARERAAVPAPRRAAVRERQHPHRPRAEQDPQGHHRQVQDAGGLPRAVPSGLGHPRPADRARGREEGRPQGQGRDEHRRGAQALPRVRRQVRRRPAPRFPPPRRLRRVGPPLPDEGLRLRGPGGPRARDHPGNRRHLPQPQARALVRVVSHGAGRSRSRLRHQEVDVGLRGVPDRGRRDRWRRSPTAGPSSRSGPPRRGRCRPTSRSPSAPTSRTRSSSRPIARSSSRPISSPRSPSASRSARRSRRSRAASSKASRPATRGSSATRW